MTQAEEGFEGHMTPEAEVGVMQPQAKEGLESLAGEEVKNGPPREPWYEGGPADTLNSDFWPPDL